MALGVTGHDGGREAELPLSPHDIGDGETESLDVRGYDTNLSCLRHRLHHASIVVTVKDV